MPALADLATVLYRPRETMRRVLAGRDRWTLQIVVLAFICSSVTDTDTERLYDVLPGLGNAGIAVILFSLVVGSLSWIIFLFILAGLATIVGRWLGGSAPAADVRAALAWGLVPVIWSPVYRVPFGILVKRFVMTPRGGTGAALLDFVANGGCSLVVLFVAFQVVFAAWSLYVASNCVAEAQQFPTVKGFANVAIVLALPLVIVLAIVAATHLHA